jgi:pyruvate formate lyase activating enzyme
METSNFSPSIHTPLFVTEINGKIRCDLCPYYCEINSGGFGKCGVRGNKSGKGIIPFYGFVSALALDPIEKKPLYLFQPGKRVLSVGGFGCNFHCPFCQNFEISMFGGAGRSNRKWTMGNGEMVSEEERPGQRFTPEDIVSIAKQTIHDGNIGVAYTYNEPLIGYEFILDCAKLVREARLDNVIVTNGYISEEPLEALLPLIDAMNIDLKGFGDGFYKKVGGDIETVMKSIELAHAHCHVEVTTLVIPGENEEDVEDIAKWLSSINPDIPLHLSRFFPRYNYSGREPTPKKTILSLCEASKKYLKNVFPGNMG